VVAGVDRDGAAAVPSGGVLVHARLQSRVDMLMDAPVPEGFMTSLVPFASALLALAAAGYVTTTAGHAQSVDAARALRMERVDALNYRALDSSQRSRRAATAERDRL